MKQRFGTRASVDRCIQGHTERLFSTLETAACLGCKRVAVPQRGGRKARIARVELRAMPIVRKTNLEAKNPFVYS